MKQKSILIEGVEYHLNGQLGQGGTGVVYLGEANGERYAIKKVTLEDRHKKSGRRRNARYLQEVNYGKTSSSKRVIKVLASEIKQKMLKDGTTVSCLYYVMPQYCYTLRNKIKASITIKERFNLLLQLFEAVSDFHADGVVHRDLKPENILIDENGNLVITDFGIASFSGSPLTVSEEFLGNRWYYAPEQGKGRDATAISYMADIFSLGLITNELFTLEKPMGCTYKTIKSMYPYLADMDKLIERMTDQVPSSRISIGAAWSELERIYSSFVSSVEQTELYLDINSEVSLSDDLKQQAVEDVLLASWLVKDLSEEEWGSINSKYHCNIHYTIKESLKNAIISLKILDRCERKFEYESNVYESLSASSRLECYQRRPSKDACSRLDERLEVLKFKLPNNAGSYLHGRIRKYFDSCCDYHCEEILRGIPADIKEVKDNLNDSPILWIAEYVALNLSEIMDQMDSFDLWQFIYIFDAESSCLDDFLNRNESARDRTEESYRLKEAKNVLGNLSKDYNSVSILLRGSDAIVTFADIDQYHEFCTLCKTKAEGDYVFEGDVIDLLKPFFENERIVQLRMSYMFDIPHTLTRLLTS